MKYIAPPPEAQDITSANTVYYIDHSAVAMVAQHYPIVT